MVFSFFQPSSGIEPSTAGAGETPTPPAKTKWRRIRARRGCPRTQPGRNGDALGRDEDVHAHGRDEDVHAPSKDEDYNFGGRKIAESEKALLRAKKSAYMLKPNISTN